MMSLSSASPGYSRGGGAMREEWWRWWGRCCTNLPLSPPMAAQAFLPFFTHRWQPSVAAEGLLSVTRATAPGCYSEQSQPSPIIREKTALRHMRQHASVTDRKANGDRDLKRLDWPHQWNDIPPWCNCELSRQREMYYLLNRAEESYLKENSTLNRWT